MNLFWNSGQVQAQKPPGLSRKTPYLSLNSTDSAGKRPNISFKESSGFTLTDVLKHSPEPLFSLWLGSSSVLYRHSMAIFYCGDSAGCLYLLLFVVWFHNQNPTQKELFTMWIKEERDRSLLSQSSWWRHTWTWGGGESNSSRRWRPPSLQSDQTACQESLYSCVSIGGQLMDMWVAHYTFTLYMAKSKTDCVTEIHWREISDICMI